MIYSEEDLIPISSLSQYYFCSRRAGLILLEQQWEDNIHTAEGTVLHERVHQFSSESRDKLVILRSLPLRSFKLGLIGVADCVELHSAKDGFKVPWRDGKWQIVPVEYKKGRKRNRLEYEVQLCAQAMCLEEMLNCNIDKGYIYYGKDRRRNEIYFDNKYRDLVLEGVKAIVEMLETKVTPRAEKSAKCRECSLNEVCFSEVFQTSLSGYLATLLRVARGDDDQ